MKLIHFNVICPAALHWLCGHVPRKPPIPFQLQQRTKQKMEMCNGSTQYPTAWVCVWVNELVKASLGCIVGTILSLD